MSIQTTDPDRSLSQRERELAAIIKAYSEVTERLKDSHDRLNREVAGLHDELKRKNAELRRRERLAALGEMAAGLAHEIRNPLGGIALYASMLERELDGQPKPQDAAKQISRAVRSLDQLVSEILDFAQEHRLQRRLCKLGDVINEVRQAIALFPDTQNATLTIAPTDAQIMVDADPPRLRQALLNLIVNAMQAAGGRGRVRLSARRLAENQGQSGEVQIEVCDDGPGIPVESLDRIFNPFFTTKASGTGLGLAIVHRIAEAHGGSVRATNRADGGARFVLSIPPQPATFSRVPTRSASAHATVKNDSIQPETNPCAKARRCRPSPIIARKGA